MAGFKWFLYAHTFHFHFSLLWCSHTLWQVLNQRIIRRPSGEFLGIKRKNEKNKKQEKVNLGTISSQIYKNIKITSIHPHFILYLPSGKMENKRK